MDIRPLESEIEQYVMFLRAQNWAMEKSLLMIMWNVQCRVSVTNYLIENNSIGYKSRSEKIQTSSTINGQTYLNVTVTTEKEYSVESSLVISFHKLQGKICPKLISVLTE